MNTTNFTNVVAQDENFDRKNIEISPEYLLQIAKFV